MPKRITRKEIAQYKLTTGEFKGKRCIWHDGAPADVLDRYRASLRKPARKAKLKTEAAEG